MAEAAGRPGEEIRGPGRDHHRQGQCRGPGAAVGRAEGDQGQGRRDGHRRHRDRRDRRNSRRDAVRAKVAARPPGSDADRRPRASRRVGNRRSDAALTGGACPDRGTSPHGHGARPDRRVGHRRTDQQERHRRPRRQAGATGGGQRRAAAAGSPRNRTGAVARNHGAAEPDATRDRQQHAQEQADDSARVDRGRGRHDERRALPAEGQGQFQATRGHRPDLRADHGQGSGRRSQGGAHPQRELE